jgi:hypothetical protein
VRLGIDDLDCELQLGADSEAARRDVRGAAGRVVGLTGPDAAEPMLTTGKGFDFFSSLRLIRPRIAIKRWESVWSNQGKRAPAARGALAAAPSG